MTRRIVCLLVIAALAAAPRAEAMRLALYRAGAATLGPGSLEGPGRYGRGHGFNLGVTLPFMHRLGATLDLGYDTLPWEEGSEAAPGAATFAREDLRIWSVMAGADVAFRRGHAARPLVHLGLGAARVREGDAELADPAGARSSVAGTSANVLAVTASAGVRLRAPGRAIALRMTLGWTGLVRAEFAHVVPLRVQVEF